MTLPDAIAHVGLTAYGRSSYGPCPVCHAVHRGRHDRRGAIAVYGGGESWKCCASGCGVGGSAHALLAAHRFGEIPPKGDPRWREMHDQDDGDHRRRPVDREPEYPPLDEVMHVWSTALPVDDEHADGRCREWLEDRGLPANRWCKSMVPWSPSYPWIPRAVTERERSLEPSHRLVLPLYDRNGVVRSLRWRSLSTAQPKSLPPIGFQTAGLVLADDVGRDVLMGRYDRWDERVCVVEGEPDFLTWATRPRGPKSWATFGVVPGSWTEGIANRIPSGCEVIIRTHHDDKGDGYAATVERSVQGRCRVTRAALPPERIEFYKEIVSQMMSAAERYNDAR